MGRFDIAGFDAGTGDSEIAHHGFEADILGFPGSELPDLKSTSAFDIECQDGMSTVHDIPGVTGHKPGFGSLLKDGDIHPEMTAVPIKGFFGIADANAYLLNTGNGSVGFWRHGKKLTVG
jgi:hypothetical protein